MYVVNGQSLLDNSIRKYGVRSWEKYSSQDLFSVARFSQANQGKLVIKDILASS